MQKITALSNCLLTFGVALNSRVLPWSCGHGSGILIRWPCVQNGYFEQTYTPRILPFVNVLSYGCNTIVILLVGLCFHATYRPIGVIIQ